MLASNAYGLAITLGLLGYGLVEWPRKLLSKSFREATTHQYQFTAYILLGEYEESRVELEKTHKVINVRRK